MKIVLIEIVDFLIMIRVIMPNDRSIIPNAINPVDISGIAAMLVKIMNWIANLKIIDVKGISKYLSISNEEIVSKNPKNMANNPAV